MKRVYKIIYYNKIQLGVSNKSKVSRLKEVMTMINPALNYITDTYNKKYGIQENPDTKPKKFMTLQDIINGNVSGTAQGAPRTGSGLRRNKKPKRMMKYY
jgi:hypothetical protein